MVGTRGWTLTLRRGRIGRRMRFTSDAGTTEPLSPRERLPEVHGVRGTVTVRYTAPRTMVTPLVVVTGCLALAAGAIGGAWFRFDSGAAASNAVVAGASLVATVLALAAAYATLSELLSVVAIELGESKLEIRRRPFPLAPAIVVPLVRARRFEARAFYVDVVDDEGRRRELPIVVPPGSAERIAWQLGEALRAVRTAKTYRA